ncbi:MAG: alpha-glucan family phosphorylase [Planctomycetes bacterium]|nr:alpha-glucan family phosphorylase [Planctomycetota bacterium]
MEIGIANAIPTFSGGLGVLAGDTLRSAADLGLPVLGVTLLYRAGYFRQTLDAAGAQHEAPEDWEPSDHLLPLTARATVEVEGETVHVRAWSYDLLGQSGHVVPIVLLDTDLPENREQYRRLTDTLYGGDRRYRLAQEIVLGVGGVRILRALGHHDLATYHMNEGHAALLTLALLRERLATGADAAAALSHVRRHCVFTTHTPVPAGHDQFDFDLARQVLGTKALNILENAGALGEDLNMTRLALAMSRFTNGVARRHGEVSRAMFPGHAVEAITNGVHSATWTAEPFRQLFDRWIPSWRRDPQALRQALDIPTAEVETAHRSAKLALVEAVRARTGATYRDDRFTICFARRATGYKRHPLLLSDPARLRRIAHHYGPIQIVYAGKAHPRDQEGKQMIERIHQLGAGLGSYVQVCFLPGYDMELGALMTAGGDIWMNTPRPPREASGTSGMKAAHNGVPMLSTVDGWWVEGLVEGVTGWAIGPTDAQSAETCTDEDAAESLYTKLEESVLPAWKDRERWSWIMRNCIALNASYFNTHRMVLEYETKAWKPEATLSKLAGHVTLA